MQSCLMGIAILAILVDMDDRGLVDGLQPLGVRRSLRA
jgi:hypothetical protein